MEQETATGQPPPKKNRFALGVALWPLLALPVWWAVVSIYFWVNEPISDQRYAATMIGGWLLGDVVVAVAGVIGGVVYARYASRKWRMPFLETAITVIISFPVLGIVYVCGGCAVGAGIGHYLT